MLPPMPFIEVVTGWVVEYMATDDGTAAGGGAQRPLDALKRLSAQTQLVGGQRPAEELTAPVDRIRTGSGRMFR